MTLTANDLKAAETHGLDLTLDGDILTVTMTKDPHCRPTFEVRLTAFRSIVNALGCSLGYHAQNHLHEQFAAHGTWNMNSRFNIAG